MAYARCSVDDGQPILFQYLSAPFRPLSGRSCRSHPQAQALERVLMGGTHEYCSL